MFRYTLWRLGVFAGCLGVVWGLVYLGVFPRGFGESNGMWIVLLALVISAPISFVVLRGVRDRASVQIVERVDRMKANLDANRSQEDETVDAAQPTSQPASHPQGQAS
ncbi:MULTISPECIES: DUF4229 domain-containing protein [unclassified Streptomyces]|jgi:hypothetical protein|uniref:DUF4229 domain-containing protein n=1 Tax=unclassified Streptomyces TaxID=2593676 RepID=UPI002252F8E7|nr:MULTISPECIES: DUF4229 domain-containing protein [unclassified Streptomyces]MCX4811740.1 DUF4229 domain-containing protein [Streptomyces sp. NBC_01239]